MYPCFCRIEGNNKKLVKKALQYMLEEMGGWQAKNACLTAERTKPQVELNEDLLDAGFDFIENAVKEHGVGDKDGLKTIRWVEKELRRKDGPLEGWKEGLV